MDFNAQALAPLRRLLSHNERPKSKPGGLSPLSLDQLRAAVFRRRHQ
jgi:hypothetical protein